MIKFLFAGKAVSPALVLFTFRITFPLFMLVHGLFRFIGGHVEGFGGFLDSRGFLFSTSIAWFLTIMEIAGSLSIISGILMRPLCIFFIVELLTGIAMVHAENGWFVVGGGRNGVEYSVLMILGYITLGTTLPGRPKTSIGF